MFDNVGNTQRQAKTEELVAKTILEACQKQGFATNEKAKEFVQKVLIKLEGTPEDKLRQAVSQMEDFADLQHEPGDCGMTFRGLSSGFSQFDNFSKGFKPGEIVVMGGYPHKGKSTLMMRWCFEFAKQGVDVAYFPFDDDRQYLKGRVQMLGRGENVDLKTLQGKIMMFPKALQPFFEEDKKNLVAAIRAIGMADPNCKVVVVDMLNSLLDTVKDRDGNSFTSALQTVAEEVGVTLFLICRLREASGLTQKARDKQTVNPDMNSIYGDSRTVYVAGKVITLSGTFNRQKEITQGFGRDEEKQYIGLHIAKCRGGLLTNEAGENGTDKEIIYELYRSNSEMRISEVGVEEIVMPEGGR